MLKDDNHYVLSFPQMASEPSRGRGQRNTGKGGNQVVPGQIRMASGCYKDRMQSSDLSNFLE